MWTRRCRREPDVRASVGADTIATQSSARMRRHQSVVAHTQASGLKEMATRRERAAGGDGRVQSRQMVELYNAEPSLRQPPAQGLESCLKIDGNRYSDGQRSSPVLCHLEIRQQQYIEWIKKKSGWRGKCSKYWETIAVKPTCTWSSCRPERMTTAGDYYLREPGVRRVGTHNVRPWGAWREGNFSG